MKSRKGFTLIELLAVIIILGVLMIIAIPSITEYISSSRKESYVNTARQIISGARNFVNSGKVPMYDIDTTYYINASCIKTENASKSPYGDFSKAYVVVTYDGFGYNYYWTSVDVTGHGVKNVLSDLELDKDDIVSSLKADDIDETKKIEDNSKYIIIDGDCNLGEAQDVVVSTCKVNNPSLTISRNWPSVIYPGETLTIVAKLTGLEGCEIKMEWQYQKDSSSEWTVIDPKTDNRYYLTNDGYVLNIVVDGTEILGYSYRAGVYYR